MKTHVLMFCIFMCYYLVRLGGNSMNFNINKVKFEKLAKEKFGTERKLFINMIRMMYPDKDSEKFYDQRKGNFALLKIIKDLFKKMRFCVWKNCLMYHLFLY